MNIQPSASAASAAGTAHAASKGGESDKQSAEATGRQSVRDAPGGQRPETSAVEGGERLGDRGGDGRQLYDSFERADEQTPGEAEEEQGDPADAPDEPPEAQSGSHLDLEA